ncbi:MAG: site-specific DNA-methyltransferase [Phycisphaerales bacterium]|nr:site-specific DNA-methyltransferase [Phycisphaerales bacterium]
MSMRTIQAVAMAERAEPRAEPAVTSHRNEKPVPTVLKHPATGVEARVYVGDCREVIPEIEECRRGVVDLVFADPPFNWNRPYDQWDDAMARGDYLHFTEQWLSECHRALRPGGAMWVNIPDDTAAEIVVYLKRLGMEMVNWCVWHYRFGQNTVRRFINSKVHALYFVKPGGAGHGEDTQGRTWNPGEVLELSDRATTYFDPRTLSKKDGMPPGQRVPMDVWYGPYWGRIQGNNKERRGNHDNQLPEVYLERVIRACSNKGDLVLDPFLGSGTTGLAAHWLERRFIGCEYSAANAASAIERIKSEPLRIGKLQPAGTAIHAPRGVKESRRQFDGVLGPARAEKPAKVAIKKRVKRATAGAGAIRRKRSDV